MSEIRSGKQVLENKLLLVEFCEIKPDFKTFGKKINVENIFPAINYITVNKR